MGEAPTAEVPAGDAPAGELVVVVAVLGVVALALVAGVDGDFIGGYRLCRSMMLAAARHLVQEREQGLAFGIIETVNSTTVILAPILAGFLYEKNPSSIYQICLGLVGLTLVASLLFFPRMKPDHTENLPITPFKRG